MPPEEIDLTTRGQEVERQWESANGDDVPLEVAAAFLFHQLNNTPAVVPPEHYDRALNIAAAALARVAPVYVKNDKVRSRKQLLVDVARHRFKNGATELHDTNGHARSGLITERAAVMNAIPIAKQANLPFGMPSSKRGNTAAISADRPADSRRTTSKSAG